MKYEGKVRLEVERAEILDLVRWATGSLSWTLIGTTLLGGVATLGVGVTILGVFVILGCRLIYRVVALRSAARAGGARTLVVGGAGDGVGRSMAILGIQLLKRSWSLYMVVS